MGAIKKTPADKWFSLCVRIRAGFKCERCGAQHDEKSTGLHASHHHGRRIWSIRLDPLNAEALCYGCHSHCGGTQSRLDEALSRQEQDILLEKKNNLDLGRRMRKTKGKGEVSKHYRDEYKRMQELRAEGVTGRIEFVGYE